MPAEARQLEFQVLSVVLVMSAIAMLVQGWQMLMMVLVLIVFNQGQCSHPGFTVMCHRHV